MKNSSNVPCIFGRDLLACFFPYLNMKIDEVQKYKLDNEFESFFFFFEIITKLGTNNEY